MLDDRPVVFASELVQVEGSSKWCEVLTCFSVWKYELEGVG